MKRTGGAAVPFHRNSSEQEFEKCVSVENLTIAYRGRVVLRDVSLEIPDRSVTAVVGPSGCGKTSFLLCLNRLIDLIPGACIQGKIWFKGSQILVPKIDLSGLRRRMGMIFQKPNPFPLSIRKNLEYPLKEHGSKDPVRRGKTVQWALQEVGLWNEVCDRLDSPALALSGGQQQRLCLARALVLQPEVLLLDEPCSSLDPLASAVTEDLIVRFSKRFAVVIVTHNLAQARRIADQVAVFWYEDQVGILLEQGARRKIFESPGLPTTALYIQGERG